METDETENSFSVNQWIAINKFLYMYKGIGVGLLIVVILLTATCITLANKKNIVTLSGEYESSYFQSSSTQVDLKEADIKHFIEKFVTKYYAWNDLSPDVIIKNVQPLVTDSLKETMLATLKQKKDKDFLGKSIQQKITEISVEVTKESIIATFDIVLRVEGVPLIVPTEVSLHLINGAQTEWNPMGLYVSNITSHEGK